MVAIACASSRTLLPLVRGAGAQRLRGLSILNSAFWQMRVSEGRGCLQTLPSESILEKAKLGQLFVPFGGKMYTKATAMHFGGVWAVGV